MSLCFIKKPVPMTTAHPVAHPQAYFWCLNRIILQKYFSCNQGVRESSLLRDQEVGGSNPLAPTNYPSYFHCNTAVEVFSAVSIGAASGIVPRTVPTLSRPGAFQSIPDGVRLRVNVTPGGGTVAVAGQAG